MASAPRRHPAAVHLHDTDRTIFTQDTGNVHGPVTMPLPHKVLASRVAVVILQTA
jgi:hypothetical protein